MSNWSPSSAATISPTGVRNAWTQPRPASCTAAPSLRAVIGSIGVPVARALLNQALKRSSSILNAWARLTDRQRKVRRRTTSTVACSSRLATYQYGHVTRLLADFLYFVGCERAF